MMNTGDERRAMTAVLEREWLSYREAQEITGLGRTKLYQLVSSGEVAAAKVGRSVRISRHGLQEYMNSRRWGKAAQ